ncbi:hypothetical protein PQX77_008410 [Marasmius sp. AFHP31]|nr:hypothetical protein PQX77_013023 [Marasmius sp. AFHP31]KAK1228545.1 hypothetical protein PQX77_008410 [Marasmius sp. AFHP31]
MLAYLNLDGLKDLKPSQVLWTFLLTFTAYRYVNARRERSKLDAIPTLGPDGILSSYLTVWRFISDVRALVEEGVAKYGGSPFKIPTMDGWQVVVSGEQHYDDMRRAPDDVISSMAAIEDTLQLKYTMSPKINVSPLQDRVIRAPLTRNIGARFEEIRDECIHQVAQFIPAKDDWVEYTDMVGLMQNIVVRVTNRYFVGLPLCRDDDWSDLNIKFTLNVALNGMVIGLFPKILHPVAGRIFTKRHSSLRRAVRHLAPIVRERLEMERQYGPGVEWPGKPNDLISWLLDECAVNGQDWQKGSIEDLAMRVLGVNFVAVHTTSAAITTSLHRLAANPHVADTLREEINRVLEEEGGWSKTAVVKMYLLDSFLKESTRMGMIGPCGYFLLVILLLLPYNDVVLHAVGVSRVALKDFKFSDGTAIPAGTKVAMAAHNIHHTDDHYPSPDSFQASRFSDKGDTLKNHMATPTWGWLTFGAGKHACPGRFFAVNELKILLSHIVLNYDVKFPDDNAAFPDPIVIGTAFMPNNKSKVLFRKRQV